MMKREDTMSERITKKQKELLSFIDAFIKGNEYSPSYREIMRALNYKSVSTVATHVNNLIALGLLTKADDSARSLEVVEQQTTQQQHLEWLKHKIQRKQRGLQEMGTREAIKDSKTLDRAAELLGIDL